MTLELAVVIWWSMFFVYQVASRVLGLLVFWLLRDELGRAPVRLARARDIPARLRQV